MKKEILDLLCDPENGHPLFYQVTPVGPSVLLEPISGKYYPIDSGIPNFLHKRPVTGINQKYQKQYDLLSPFYNFVTKTAIRLMGASEADVRLEYLCELEIKPGMRVLEVSVGTGTNLRLLPTEAHYFGLDISNGQIRQCQHYLQRENRHAELFLGDAEHLPFRENVFDVVFHMGGINYFNDPALALREMLRVAKPGTKVVVVDETDRFTKQLARFPIVREYFKHNNGMAAPELAAPAGVDEVTTKELFGGRLWYLSFRKPHKSKKPLATVTSLLQRRMERSQV